MQNASTGQSAAVTAQALPGNGAYNAARFTAARKALAAALAAPVFTDEERARAAANALACDSLFRLALWLRNVTRVAAERAVAAAQQRTVAVARPIPAAEYTAACLRQCRLFLMQAMSNSVFSMAERVRANDNAYQTDDQRRLALWLQNVRRVADEREAALWAAHEAGASAFLSFLQH
ncbi:hypothetical protein [Hymenobacter sp. B81]|uniref:hypothetical protein n=1 Tax=Hymenobacter sp. B81 TaxID=3344878 RepID=UPI0037DC2867